jgi:hypothetical protein
LGCGSNRRSRRRAPSKETGVNAAAAVVVEPEAPAIPVVPIEPSALRSTRVPPFARDIRASIAAGRHPNVYIFATPNAWDRARHRRARHGIDSALILPPGEASDAYRWPVVPGGLLVVANGQPRMFAFELARVIVTCGTPVAVATFGDNELLIVRRPEWLAAA